jgi:hypothetical protein
MNDIGIGNCGMPCISLLYNNIFIEVKGDTTESYIGQMCAQLIVLAENMERSGNTQPDGSVV